MIRFTFYLPMTKKLYLNQKYFNTQVAYNRHKKYCMCMSYGLILNRDSFDLQWINKPLYEYLIHAWIKNTPKLILLIDNSK